MSFSLDEKELLALEQFLTRRQARGKFLPLFQAARGRHSLTRAEISAAKSLTYPKITELLVKCLDRSWIDFNEVAKILDESELAGRQHVCIFKLPPDDSERILEALRTPQTLTDALPVMKDFLQVPSQSTARILVDTPNEIAVKIIAIRSYWLSEFVKDDPGEQIIRRWKMTERSALIIKANSQTGILQVRVPPRETGPSDTANGVYKFLNEVVLEHYGVEKGRWFDDVLFFPIAETYPRLLQNKTDFVLKLDTPENEEIRSRMSKKGSATDLTDLRDNPNWKFENGYARRAIRGHWISTPSKLFVHMHFDTVNLGKKKLTRDIARVFVPKFCPDRDLDHVVEQIRNHL